MKRLLIIAGVLFVILVGVSIYTFAILLPGQASQSSVSNATATPSLAVPTPKTAKARQFIGTIQSLGNQTLVIVVTRTKKVVTVNVNANTKYATPTGLTSFSSLKVGQTVKVKGHVDPQDTTALLAASILVMTTSGQ